MTFAHTGIVASDIRVEHAATGKPIVDEVAFAVAPGSVLALVGESGSGKTTAAMALLGHARPGARITKGRVDVAGVDILSLTDRALRRCRGTLTSYVGQDPASSLNPSMRIGAEMRELARTHRLPADAAPRLIVEYLTRVGLPSDNSFLSRYPHQLSGGQIQRVLVAMALLVDPALVVLDEPTTGLDVKVQRDVLDVIAELKRTARAAIVYVTHDLAVVSEVADQVAVLYGGRIVEQAATRDLFAAPQHPYMVRLLGSVPRIAPVRVRLRPIEGTAIGIFERPQGCAFEPRCPVRLPRCAVEMPASVAVADTHTVRCFNAGFDGAPTEADGGADAGPPVGEVLLEVAGVSAWFPTTRSLTSVGRPVDATTAPVLHHVSFVLRTNECLGVVGQSGSGKSTLARAIVGLHRHRDGEIRLGAAELANSSRERTRAQQREIQIVFQNPAASLNPKHRVFESLRYVLRRHAGISDRASQRVRATALLDMVRLPASALDRLPRDLSGGEKQRVAIARALAARPRLLLCDEITSSLDVSVQAAIVNLIEELRRELDDLTVLFITHDLAVVRAVADRILVMQHGRLVEEGAPEQILFEPNAEYTRELISAIPTIPDSNVLAATAPANGSATDS